MPSQRELVIQGLLTKLATIAPAVGSSVTVKTVERGLRLFNQVAADERPYLGVYVGIGRNTLTSSRLTRMALTVRIVGYLELAADLSLDVRAAAADAFLADVKRVLLADITLGGAATSVSTVTEGTDEGAESPGGFIELELEVIYFHSFTEI